MPDNTLKIGAEADLQQVVTAMNSGAEATRQAIDKMLVSFQEASTGSARAVSRITEDTRAGAVSVSEEWTRVAQSTLAYNAALKEVSAATYLARKAGEDDASATLLLASAKQKAALAARELAAAEKAVAVSAEETAGAEGLLAGALGEVLGPLIGLEILRRRIEDAANFALQMRNLSAITGISAVELAGLHDVLGEMGVQWDSVAIGLGKMAKSQQDAIDGSQKQIVAFERMGISINQLKQLSPEELFFRLADGFNKTGSTAEKNAVAVELFGRGGRALIPVFQVGSERLREFVEEGGKASGVSDENTEAAARWHAITEKISAGIRALALESMPTLMKSGAVFVAVFEGLAASVVTVVDVIATAIATALEGLDGLGKVMYDVTTGNFNNIAKDATTAQDRIVARWQSTASDIKVAWGTVAHDVKALWSGADVSIPQPKPPLGGEDDLPGTGSASNRLQEWKRELQAKKDAEDGFHELSKNDEAAFWESKLAIAQGDAKLYAQVYHEMRQAEREGMKVSLKDELSGVQERVAATKSGSLQRVIILGEEVAYLKALGADQTEDYKRLNRELAAATKDYAEEQAKAAVQADRQKAESTRRASEERVAAERAVLEHLKALGLEGTAEYTAQLRRVTAAELEAHNEKIKLAELDIGQEKIRAQSSIEVSRQQVQTNFDLHRINGQQRISLLKELENQEYEVQKEALEKKLALLEKDPTISPVQLRQIQNQIENLTREHNNKIAQFNTQAVKESQQKYDQFFSHLNSGFTGALNGMLSGHQGFMRGLMNLWNSGVEYIIDKIALIGLKWFEQHVIMRAISTVFHGQEQAEEAAAQSAAVAEKSAANLAMGLSDAAVAAAGTFAYYSSFAPEIAPAMAAEAYGQGLGWASLAAFHTGGISSTEQLAVLKRNEMVLDPVLSSGFQKMLGGGTAPATPANSGGHRLWTGDMNIHGVSDPQAAADLAVAQMKTYFRTGGVHRR